MVNYIIVIKIRLYCYSQLIKLAKIIFVSESVLKQKSFYIIFSYYLYDLYLLATPPK